MAKLRKLCRRENGVNGQGLIDSWKIREGCRPLSINPQVLHTIMIYHHTLTTNTFSLGGSSVRVHTSSAVVDGCRAFSPKGSHA